MDSKEVERLLRELLAVVREGNCVIAEIVIEGALRKLELERNSTKFWCWP